MKKNMKRLSVMLLLGILPSANLSAKNIGDSKHGEAECPKFAKPFVDGYKAVETSVTKGYAAIEDRCVGLLFRKKGESVAQAKERLKQSRRQAEEEARTRAHRIER